MLFRAIRQINLYLLENTSLIYFLDFINANSDAYSQMEEIENQFWWKIILRGVLAVWRIIIRRDFVALFLLLGESWDL